MYSANNVAAATSNGLATERNISNAASGPVTAVAGQPAIATKEEVICFSKDNEGHGSHTPLINLSTNPEDRLVELQKELAELKTNMDLIVNAKVEAKLKEISGRNTAAENSIRTTDMRSPENEKDSNKEEKAQCNRKAPINGPTNRDAATAKKIKGSKLLSGGSKDKKRGHRAMSRKNKKKLKRTNTESSDSASNREIKRFSDWLLNQPTVTPIEWQKQLQTIMIEKREKHNVKKCVHRIISKAKQCGTLRKIHYGGAGRGILHHGLDHFSRGRVDVSPSDRPTDIGGRQSLMTNEPTGDTAPTDNEQSAFEAPDSRLETRW
mmetsp:Transcript_33372/g.80718  ORF Transcript_33372/g.80718 Transcript_33372/m.80718 type:complete len:322 (-) Transcript_33372:21-986(-)